RSRFRPRLSNVGIVSPTLDTRTLLCHRTRFNSSIDTCNDRIRRACAPASAHVPPPSTSRTSRGSVTDRSTQNHCGVFGNRLHPRFTRTHLTSHSHDETGRPVRGSPDGTALRLSRRPGASVVPGLQGDVVEHVAVA